MEAFACKSSRSVREMERRRKDLPFKEKRFQVFYLMNMHEDAPFTSTFDLILLNESAFKIKVPLCVTQLMHTFLMHTSFYIFLLFFEVCWQIPAC